MAYAGSFVTFGQGNGIVVATAGNTEVGRISQTIEQRTNLSTPLTRKFDKFSRTLLYVILGLAALTLAVGLGQGQTFAGMFEAAVALAVSAIPEGLPAVVTVTLAIGVNRMARRHAIIRKLPAVETLGGATVICSDKTGTLTENQMTVQAIYAGGDRFSVSGTGYSPEGEIGELGERLPVALRQCLIAGLLCNDSHLEEKSDRWVVVGDPTEGALIAVAKKAGLSQSELVESIPRLDAIPFESQFQYMATLHEVGSRESVGAGLETRPYGSWEESQVIYVKGSVEAILSRTRQMLDKNGNPIAVNRAEVEQQVEFMAKQGLRVLAFAKKTVGNNQNSVDHDDLESDLIFIGLQGMIDPPRAEAIAAVRNCQSAGIGVKMITGDHITTASAIAERMGLQKDGRVNYSPLLRGAGSFQ